MNFASILFVALILVIPAILIQRFKLYFLISGYSTMSKEKRENIDWAGFALLMRNVFVSAAIMLLVGFYILELLGLQEYLPFIMIGVILLAVVILIGYGNYKYNYYKKGGLPKELIKNYKHPRYALVYTIGIAVIFISAILFIGTRNPTVVLDKNQIHVKGMYGFTSDLSAITLADTVSQLPDILMRSNGFAGVGVLKGYFRLKNSKTVTLFIHKKSKPYILLSLEGDKIVYLNYRENEKTVELYKKIISYREFK